MMGLIQFHQPMRSAMMDPQEQSHQFVNTSIWFKNEQVFLKHFGRLQETRGQGSNPHNTFNDLNRVCRRFGTEVVVYLDMAIFNE